MSGNNMKSVEKDLSVVQKLTFLILGIIIGTILQSDR